MKLWNFKIGKDKRKTGFPLSQTSRIVVDRPKHDIGNKEFKKLVNIGLKPLLQNLGFEGKDYFYHRLRNDNIETILLGTSRYGKAICVNAEIKESNGTVPTKQVEIEKLKSISPNKIGWKRLSPDKQDCWWWFRPTEEENQKVFNEIYKLISTEGEKYFMTNNK
jgi:hypothetical protein